VTKRIILVGSAYPLRGGLATYNERLMREFKNEGHEVSIKTFSLQYPEFLFPGKTQYSSDSKPEDLDIEVCVNSVNPLNWIKIGRQIKKLKPDLIIFKYWTPFMAPCFGTIIRFAKSKNTKVITVCDNIIPHEKHFFDDALNTYFINCNDAFICMSESVQRDLLKYRPDAKNILTPHPVYDNFGDLLNKQDARNKFGLKADDKVILFFGFIRQYKGLDILLHAIADERVRAMNIKAIIAGEYYEDATPYKELIKELKLENNLIIRDDFIPNDEVKDFFSAVDIVVQPYKSATQSGISQICYHFEKPMIVTNVGGLPEIVPHLKCGYVCEVNPTAIADAMVDFFNNNQRPEFAAHLKEEKKKYSWSQMTEAILKLTTG
jgi:D-inositol-3-phosphate glycosyltransferase